jgi:asparagine synthase (glutamine-hydrolysing)
MCGIGGVIHLSGKRVGDLERRLRVINHLLEHRGPDGEGVWMHPGGHVGFAHRRLSIIDLDGGSQPMLHENGSCLTYNGELYNYPELRSVLGASAFRSQSDTEVLLRALHTWGAAALDRLRGMYAFGHWDESTGELFCARDRFGIKPLYYTVVGDLLHFASEAKALLPFVSAIGTDREGLMDYLAFQFCLGGKTLFEGIHELPPGHSLRVRGDVVAIDRYWEVYYDLDFDHTARYFEDRIRELLDESVSLHLRSDVPVGAYLSGGLDSSVIACLASERAGPMNAFTGRFGDGPEFDESAYARVVADARGLDLHVVDIDAQDFARSIEDVVYHLDYPTAGPGSFPQYMVSREAARHNKVVLGGQGGDEIFGGYARYLVAYFEQCIKAAIDGTMHDGNFIVTYESIIPNLTALASYKPMLREFWREGLFEDLDARYYRLIRRAPLENDEVRWEALPDYRPFETFRSIFHGENVGQQSYFDKMTHFDFKTLLPALLHVEDRVSMAHGLEARVPLLDHELVELAATMPSDVKFKDGTMKHVLKRAARTIVPAAIGARQDKMGFPVPLTRWVAGDLREFVHDTLGSGAALGREYIDNRRVLDGLECEASFGRTTWGMLSLELWQQVFHDRSRHYAELMEQPLERASP